MTRVVSCPGSLLLAGEYLVTEEGGRGMAVAVPPRARAAVSSLPDGPAVVESMYAGHTERWSADAPENGRLPRAVYRHLTEAGMNSTEVHLAVDTGMFYGSDGRKSGFGSSAAGALLLTAGLRSRSPDREIDIAQAAIDAHREFQGGRGSGYDVMCSSRGGFGLFTGGLHPKWRPLTWPRDVEAWIVSGPAPVSSPDAVSRYEIWKRQHPDDHLKFVDDAESAIAAYVDGVGNEGPRFITALAELGRLGRFLGQEIGIPAIPKLPGQLARLAESRPRDHLSVKCLGAGGELILVAAARGSLEAAERDLLTQAVEEGLARHLVVDTAGLTEDTL